MHAVIRTNAITFRFTPEAYAELQAKVQQPFVGDKTTDLQAGFQLGIQHMLNVIRKDYVIGMPGR